MIMATLDADENAKAVKKSVTENGRISIKEIADDVTISAAIFGHETNNSEICTEIAKYQPKYSSHKHFQKV